MITVAPVGAEATREQNPNLPLSPEEIASAAVEACAAGASVVHLHVRDDAGRPTQDLSLFGRAIGLIRARCSAVVQVSTGGAVGTPAARRLQPVTLGPEMATLTCGTVNFGDEVFANPLPLIRQFARKMRQCGVRPEIEVFDSGAVATAGRLVDEGLLDAPLHFNLVMGVPGGVPPTARHLMCLVDSLPSGSTWTVTGVGRHQLPLSTLAIVLGGHVRVGFEDNLYYSRGQLAESNAQLVARIARLAGELGRPVATPEQARELLRLPVTRKGDGA